MEKKKKRKKFDEATKKRAVEEYNLTGNVSAVARKYGVARTTLLEWLQIFNNLHLKDEKIAIAAVSAINRASDAVVKSIEANAATREEFMRAHYTELSIALSNNLKAISDRLESDIEKLSLRDLAASLTALTNMAKEFLPVEEKGATQINLLQQTITNN